MHFGPSSPRVEPGRGMPPHLGQTHPHRRQLLLLGDSGDLLPVLGGPHAVLGFPDTAGTERGMQRRNVAPHLPQGMLLVGSQGQEARASPGATGAWECPQNLTPHPPAQAQLQAKQFLWGVPASLQPVPTLQ